MLFDKLLKYILQQEGVKGTINLALIKDMEMRRLNCAFRKRDRTTDVLSFPMGENGVLGDIAISTETARRQCQAFGLTYRQELERLFIHGVLHLLGYEHGKEMRDAEKTYQKFCLC